MSAQGSTLSATGARGVQTQGRYHRQQAQLMQRSGGQTEFGVLQKQRRQGWRGESWKTRSGSNEKGGGSVAHEDASHITVGWVCPRES